jgi:four helix bundle protein
MMQDFKSLDVWREAKSLVLIIYKITETFPKHELFGLTNQMRRSAVSIPSNIAEGIGRRTNKDKTQFLYTSRGSLFELETQYIIAHELLYITIEDFNTLTNQVIKCRQLINGYINYLKDKDD